MVYCSSSISNSYKAESVRTKYVRLSHYVTLCLSRENLTVGLNDTPLGLEIMQKLIARSPDHTSMIWMTLDLFPSRNEDHITAFRIIGETNSPSRNKGHVTIFPTFSQKVMARSPDPTNMIRTTLNLLP